MSNATKDVPAAGENLLPAVLDYGQDAGVGFEEMGSNELQIPFLALLQDLSPQVTGADGKEIRGARAGMLLNTVTGELLGTEVVFVPCARQHIFTAWRPRSEGGGFRGRFAAADPLVQKAIAGSPTFGKYKTAEGDELQETFYLYGLVVRKDEPPSPVVIAFASTKIRIYRGFITNAKSCTVQVPGVGAVNPPLFAHRLRISTARQKNQKGTFYNLVIGPAIGSTLKESLLPNTDPLFKAGRDFRALVTAGKAKAADEEQHGAEEGEESAF